MIRFTKDGKVVRNAPWASWDELADALDVAVAALRNVERAYDDAGASRYEIAQIIKNALRQIGAEHD